MVEDLRQIVQARLEHLMRSRGVKRAALKKNLRRNKNTFTKWFASDTAPDLRLSDIEDICNALDVLPSELFHGDVDDHQLNLPFDERRNQQLSLHWTGHSLIMRKGPTTAPAIPKAVDSVAQS